MPTFKVEFEYDEYDYEVREDEDGFEYEEEVVETFEDYIYIDDAEDEAEAVDLAIDTLYGYEGLSVLRATLVEDED